MHMDGTIGVPRVRRGKSKLMQTYAQAMADAGKRVYGPRPDGTFGLVEPRVIVAVDPASGEDESVVIVGGGI